MALSFTYNGETFTILRAWTKQRTPVPTFDGLDVLSFDVSYVCEGIFLKTTAADRKTDIDTLKAKLGEHGKDFKITSNAVDIIELLAADAHGDGPFPELTIPGSGEPLKLGQNTPFTFTIRGRIDPEGAGTILAQSEQKTRSFDKKGMETRTIRGQIKVAVGSSAEGEIATITPALPAGFENERSDFVIDDDDLVMDYTFIDRQTNESNPTNAKEASWTVALTTNNGMETWVLAGRLEFETGKAIAESEVDTLIDQYIPDDASITTRSVTAGPRENTLNFTITAVRAYAEGNHLEFRQTYTLRAINQRAVFKAVGKQGDDVRQDTVNPDLFVIQTGSAKGHTAFPAFPDFEFDVDDVIENEQTFGEIVFDQEGQIAEANISWRYRGQVINEISDAKDANISTQFLSQSDAEDAHPASGQQAPTDVV